MVLPLGTASTFVTKRIRSCIVLYGTSTLINLPTIYLPQGDSKGVATSFHVSQLLLNEHIPEIEEFRISVSIDDGREIGFTWTISELAATKEVCTYSGGTGSFTELACILQFLD